MGRRGEVGLAGEGGEVGAGETPPFGRHNSPLIQSRGREGVGRGTDLKFSPALKVGSFHFDLGEKIRPALNNDEFWSRRETGLRKHSARCVERSSRY